MLKWCCCISAKKTRSTLKNDVYFKRVDEPIFLQPIRIDEVLFRTSAHYEKHVSADYLSEFESCEINIQQPSFSIPYDCVPNIENDILLTHSKYLDESCDTDVQPSKVSKQQPKGDSAIESGYNPSDSDDERTFVNLPCLDMHLTDGNNSTNEKNVDESCDTYIQSSKQQPKGDDSASYSDDEHIICIYNLPCHDVDMQLMDGNNETSEALDLFASQITILGLKEQFVVEFRRLPCDLRHHSDNEDWIKTFLENNYDAIEELDSLKQSTSEELLLKIGFKENSNAVTTILLKSKLYRHNHVDPIYAVKRFVTDEFRYNADLSNECHLLHESDFFEGTISVDCTITPKGAISEDTVVSQLITTEIEQVRQESDQSQLLFHGTDIESAYDISKGGIAVSMGSQKRDFSDGKGFYLTNNFEDAKKWALSMAQKPAVLIYKIPKSHLEKAKKLSLFEESQTGQEWKDIVLANRSGIISWKMRKMLQQFEYIEGPVSITETDMSDSGEVVLSRKPLPGSYQLCVINKCLADKISKCLAKVVLYNCKFL